MGRGMKARLHERSELRNRQYVFKDRAHAGKVLVSMLAPEYAKVANLFVLAVPSGGVPVALEVSEGLGSPMDLLIVRKLQIPGNPEAGFGAMTRGGAVFLNKALLEELHLREAEIEKQKRIVKEELDKRNQLFRDGRPSPDLESKSVILVDDGLASGYTMMASIDEAKKRNAARTTVAVPTASLSSLERLGDMADEIYCPNIREGAFFAVADAYEDWYDLDHEEVMRLIGKKGDENRKERYPTDSTNTSPV
jgi:putative phosphoribosyl transferase